MADCPAPRYADGMRQRSFLLAGLVVAIAAGGLAAGMLRPRPKPVLDPGPQPALPVLIANYRLADRIELASGARVLWLERRGQVWGLSQSGGYPVRPDAANALVDGLLGLKLGHAVPGGAADGTLVRVLAVSGEVLGAVVVGSDGAVRRPGLPAAWQALPPLQVSADVKDWIDDRLPVPDLAQVTIAGGDEASNAALRRSLAVLRFTAVRANPQIRAEAVRSVRLALPNGTATLTLGQFDGQDWLHVSGSSSWARTLAPYAFAVPAGGVAW